MRLRNWTAGAAVVALLLSGSTASLAKDDDSPADALRAIVAG